MSTCPACASTLEPGDVRCNACGESFDLSATRTQPPPATGAARDADGGAAAVGRARFPPGHLLAGRYRIVGLLGRGGMGEVYRAEDLKLDEDVALKFLPERLAVNGAALARFHQEARVARQIAHRNVCRVHDIGEVDGLHYLTMEHIDGEDLASLLRRIGRLPQDKATELGRQVCLGLAAAHEAGILHRDLKPANVMIDGSGRAKITDFGLASLMTEAGGGAPLAGTPAYMAPEQLDGERPSVRSDLYALGLVLYEMFTGRRPFPEVGWQQLAEQRREALPETPSSHLEAIDPLAERVLLRCLEREPERRPASAIEVAAGLPGGDPLRAALDAGETPSPEMVAGARVEGSLSPLAVLTLLILGLGAFAFHLAHVDEWTVIGRQGMEKGHEVLEEKAREILAGQGLLGPPPEKEWVVRGFAFDWPNVRRELKARADAPDRAAPGAAADGAPPRVRFWFRRSPAPFAADTRDPVSAHHPSLHRPGSSVVQLGPDGELLSLRAIPGETASGETDMPPSDDDPWDRLFALAGLDRQRFTPAEPTWQLALPTDSRLAWTGEAWGGEIRVEAAASGGRPVAFDLVLPWTRAVPESAVRGFVSAFLWVVFFSVLCVAALLAARNLRLGRGDRRGAARLAGAFFAMGAVAALLDLGPGEARDVFSESFRGLIYAIGTAMVLWLLYLAIEPFLRRLRPAMLVSWTRLLAGRFRDPIVGRDVLVGMVLALVTTVAGGWARGQLHTIPPLPWRLEGPLKALSDWLSWSLYIGLVLAFGMGVVFVVLRLLLRRDLVAGGALFLLYLGISMRAFTPSEEPLVWILGILTIGARIAVLLRFGVLPILAQVACWEIIVLWPLTGDFGAWYADVTLLATVLVVGGLLISARAALGKQRLLPKGVLDPG